MSIWGDCCLGGGGGASGGGCHRYMEQSGFVCGWPGGQESFRMVNPLNAMVFR